MGSPPRVRGKGRDAGRHRRRHGITPACAGKRPPKSGWRLWHWDHPRVCGEKLRSHLRSSGRGGITPACAGKSSSSFWCSGVSIGSPPRVRGKAGLVGGHADYERITPACAGKRWPEADVLANGWDHPRVCGEKQFRVGCFRGDVGSPPRVRGKGVLRHVRAVIPGITPACAGKSVG